MVDLKDYAERDIGTALNKYASSRFDISAGLPDMPYGPDKINEIVSAFNGLEPGEDIIHGNDIQVKELQGTQRAFEYGKYTDDILKKIHIALKVPVTMFDKPEQARAIFEPYVKHLQSAVEAALNSQLMPQLESGEAKFKFRQINVDDAFTKAKKDMIYLSEGVLSPGEVREERFKQLENSAKRITVPTLLVQGALSDILTNKEKEEFLNAVPHAKFAEIQQATHMVVGDKNDIFAEAIVDFLSEHIE